MTILLITDDAAFGKVVVEVARRHGIDLRRSPKPDGGHELDGVEATGVLMANGSSDGVTPDDWLARVPRVVLAVPGDDGAPQPDGVRVLELPTSEETLSVALTWLSGDGSSPN